jgi:hypothetical protein
MIMNLFIYFNQSKRYSLDYDAFIKSHFTFGKYSNDDNQELDLTSLSIKLSDTRTENNNQFHDTLISSSMSTSTSNIQL